MTILSPTSRGTSMPTASRAIKAGYPWFLLLVTLFGFALRLAFLNRPALWFDEAATFSRTCGTYQQMLDVLREDGFGPLHYEVEWVIAQKFHMTATMLRLWPAITGALTVPAIYLLGFELLGRRVARTAALLAACSGFLLAYSRDAKMYMPLWFGITLNVACLLCWMRTGRLTAWLGFVAGGCLAVGLHFTGFSVLALDVLIGLTGQNLTWRKCLMLVLGITLIVSGPVGYAGKFNQLQSQLDRQGWRASGIDWVVGRTNGHDGAALAADSAASYLFAFSWLDQQNALVSVPRWLMGSSAALLALLVAAFAVGVIPWRRSAIDSFTLPTRRSALWLCLWILAPAYGFYRVTVPIASAWTDWWVILQQSLLANHAYLWMLLGFVVSMILLRLPIARWIVKTLGAALIAWTAAVAAATAVLGDSFSTVTPPRWLWIHPVAPLAAIVILLAVACTALSGTIRRRILSLTGLVVGVAVTLAVFQGIDVVIASIDTHAVWMPRYLGFIFPAVIVAAAALIQRLPSVILRGSLLTLLLSVNLAQAAAHIFVSNEPAVDRAAADVIASFNSNGQMLAFTPDPNPRRGPNGTGSITMFSGEFYLVQYSGRQLTPEQFREEMVQSTFPLREENDPSEIAAAVKREPAVGRFVFWDQIPEGQQIPSEDLQPLLGTTWRRESQELYPVRCFWDWGELYIYRRRVYTK